VDIEKRLILHHARGSGDTLETRILRKGAIALNPPGIAIDCAACFSFD